MSSALIGLDFGEKRIGVAVVPEGTTIAFPLKMILRSGREQLAAELEKLIKEQRAGKIIVGLPKTLKGTIGPAAEKLIKEVEWLKTRLNIPIELWDERLSSKEVERMLIDADVRREKRKEVIDQLAAQRILQGYLDRQAAGH